MASSALRLRRALSFSSALAARSSTISSSTATVSQSPLFRVPFSSSPPSTANLLPKFGSRCVHSTSLSLSASRSYNHGDDQIDENTILFEGCDYKHWLFVMDFSKHDPRPTPEQMVETYVQTMCKVFGSVEESKKRIYACSTTTYTGFQAEMDEEMASRFEDNPDVIFVLPDSYIDPVNKEYGGDKYINGTIIPRPPPIQYGRQRRARVPPQDQPRRPVYNEQGSMPRDGQNFNPQQNFQQQNYGPRQNYPPQQNYGPGPRENQGRTQNYPPQQNYAPPQQNYAPPQNYPPRQNFVPPRQGERMDRMPPYNRGNYNQESGGGQNIAPPSSSGEAQYGQGGRGSYGQNQTGHFEQGYAAHGENRHFNHPQGEQNIAGQKQQ